MLLNKANDNVILTEEERNDMLAGVKDACQTLLERLGIHTANDHNTRETAYRMAKMYVNEIFSGRYTAMPNPKDFDNVQDVNQIYTVGPMRVRSTCSHHFAPIIGQAWVGIITSSTGRLLGLSKFSRLADWIFSRPQIQEEATQQYANLLERLLSPKALGVVVRADHLCTQWRGIRDPGVKMVTSVVHGTFEQDSTARAEFFNLIKGQGY
jgi:GTP cyclohydrolase I